MKIFLVLKDIYHKVKFLMNSEPQNSSLSELDSAGNPVNFTPPPIEPPEQDVQNNNLEK